MTPLKVAQTSAKLNPGQSNRGETKSIEATTPEIGPVGLWSSKSSILVSSAVAPNFPHTHMQMQWRI